MNVESLPDVAVRDLLPRDGNAVEIALENTSVLSEVQINPVVDMGNNEVLETIPLLPVTTATQSSPIRSLDNVATLTPSLDLETVTLENAGATTTTTPVVGDWDDAVVGGVEGVSGSFSPTTSPASALMEGVLPADVTASTSAATTTTEAPALPLVHISHNDNELRFERGQCTLVGDGSFYCQPLRPTVGDKDGLLAAPDSDGDLEIYLVTDGQYNQITSNVVDDAAPYFDQLSNTIVWQRLIDDRYQLFSYDIEAGTERSVTSSQTHDMEPTRQGKYTVWQRWVGEYWQIMLSDGETEMQVSQTERHNLSPFIRGQFIMWNTKNAKGEQQVETYDMLTRTYTTIDDGEEATMMNPRMMMVYEAVFENGDIMTRGFDLRTGKVVPLAALPRDVPENIPDSDSTGETKALIGNKSNGKETDVENQPEPTGTATPPVLPPTTATTSEPTLDLRTTYATATVPIAPESQVFNETFDLLIEAKPSTQISTITE